MVLTTRVPSLTCEVVAPAFQDLLRSIPSFSKTEHTPSAEDFDWALHPGGSMIITGVQTALGISEDQLRASYDIYMNYGNSSSATIMSVMNRLRTLGEGRDNVVACAFGPGISMEMMILTRRRGSPNEFMTNGYTEANGHVHEHGQADMNGTIGIPMEDVD